nr:RecName: Full=Snaclec trowaglerix subunit alpha [Tropidolaemus wagleri]
FKCMSEWYW